MSLTQELLKSYIHYDPEHGDFFWLKDTNSRGPSQIGEVAGCTNSSGYWVIGLLGQHLYGHRLAWLFVHGYMPEYIDHVNGKPWDNRLCNLRECTHSENLANYKRRRNNVERHGTKWRVRVVKDGYRYEFGSYTTPEEANLIADVARDKLFGEFTQSWPNQ